MLKKISALLAVGAAAMFITGCSSVETARNFNGLGVATSRVTPIAHVNASIYGCYLFDSIPLFAGSPNSPGKVMAFKDSVELDNCMRMLMEKSRGIGASKVIDLQSRVEERWLWWSLILWVHEVQISGTAIK